MKLKLFANPLFLFVVAMLSLPAEGLEVSALSAQAGDLSGGVRTLSAQDGRTLKMYSNQQGKLAVTFDFSGTVTGQTYSLDAWFSQRSARDQFSFQVQAANGQFITLGTVSGSGYKSLKYVFAVSGPAVRIRITAPLDSGDCELDQLVLIGTSQIPAPVPTPGPSPAPAPQPAPVPAPIPPPTPGQVMSIPAGTSWYWQLQGTIKTGVNATVYDIDLFDTSASTIAQLKAQGHAVICYFSAGTYENWRPDAAAFPAASLGAALPDWPGEKWLDVRNPAVKTIMGGRMDMAKSKGCDGLEPDNVDGFDNRNGVGLTKQDQITYNAALADMAHQRGLVVALKNSTALVSSLVGKFDFAVVEECFAYSECDAYTPFVKQGKAVLNAEYSKFSATTCTQAKQLGLSTAFFNLDLNGSVFNPCP